MHGDLLDNEQSIQASAAVFQGFPDSYNLFYVE